MIFKGIPVSYKKNLYQFRQRGKLRHVIESTIDSILSGEFEVDKEKAKFPFKTIELKDNRDAFAKVETAKSFGNDNISIATL